MSRALALSWFFFVVCLSPLTAEDKEIKLLDLNEINLLFETPQYQSSDSLGKQFKSLDDLQAVYPDLVSQLETGSGAALAASLIALQVEQSNLTRIAYILLDSLLVEKRTEAALAFLEQLSETFPEDYRLLNNLAWLYVSLQPEFRDADKSLKLAKKALMIAPSDARVWSTLSEAYFCMGNYPEAKKHARIAYKLIAETQAGEPVVQQYKKQLKRAEAAEQSMDILF